MTKSLFKTTCIIKLKSDNPITCFIYISHLPPILTLIKQSESVVGSSVFFNRSSNLLSYLPVIDLYTLYAISAFSYQPFIKSA